MKSSLTKHAQAEGSWEEKFFNNFKKERKSVSVWQSWVISPPWNCQRVFCLSHLKAVNLKLAIGSQWEKLVFCVQLPANLGNGGDDDDEAGGDDGEAGGDDGEAGGDDGDDNVQVIYM